jgi:hypothetical protein
MMESTYDQWRRVKQPRRFGALAEAGTIKQGRQGSLPPKALHLFPRKSRSQGKIQPRLAWARHRLPTHVKLSCQLNAKKLGASIYPDFFSSYASIRIKRAIIATYKARYEEAQVGAEMPGCVNEVKIEMEGLVA